MLAFFPCLDISSIAPLEQTRLRFSWQGGGIYVYIGAEATLIDSNVYRNEAASVRSPLNVPRHFFHRPLELLELTLD